MCPSPHFLPSYFQIRVKSLPPHWGLQETWVTPPSSCDLQHFVEIALQSHKLVVWMRILISSLVSCVSWVSLAVASRSVTETQDADFVQWSTQNLGRLFYACRTQIWKLKAILLQCFVFGWGWQVVENMKAIEILPKLTPDVLKRIDSVVHNKPKQPDQYRWRIELLSLRCFLQDNKWFYFAGKLEAFLLQKNDNFGAIVWNASVVSRHAIQICIFCLL